MQYLRRVSRTRLVDPQNPTPLRAREEHGYISPFLQKSSRGPAFVLDYIGVVSYYRDMKRAQYSKWIVKVTDAQEMPIRTEEFPTEAAANARYTEISAKVEADFAAGRFSSEIAEKPQGRY